MIVFNLKCKLCELTFEGWFDSTKEYSRQKKQSLMQTKATFTIVYAPEFDLFFFVFVSKFLAYSNSDL